MFARLAKFLVVTALVATTGAHWAALQTVAWTTMLANNLRSQSFTQAVSDTFDGEHPCCLCKAIKVGKQSEQKSAAVAPILKMEFPPATGRIVLISPASFQVLPLHDHFADSFISPPLLQPPRRLFA
ncbi:MAG TPA: hypothetical protein VL863_10585 [bacterium]|nr:hypothetical protein [bacterium]